MSRRRGSLPAFFGASLLICTVGLSCSLKLTNMSAPVIADPREDMHLDCYFDMGIEELYAVKWYKDDAEFFRYMPSNDPNLLTFAVKGIKLILQDTSCGQSHCKIHLTSLTRNLSSGAYRCEVSSGAPAFRLASGTHHITVAAVPRDGPRITGIGDSYSLGDPLTALCVSPPADPVPELSWYINNHQARPESVREETKSNPDEHGLSSSSSSLRLPKIERKHLQGSIIHLRCEAILPRVPVQPLSVGQTIIVRTRPQQVNNEKLHWPNSSSTSRNPHNYNGAFISIVVALTSVRWGL